MDFIVSYVHYSDKGPTHDYFDDEIVHAKDADEARVIFEAEHEGCDHVISVHLYV